MEAVAAEPLVAQAAIRQRQQVPTAFPFLHPAERLQNYLEQ